MHTLNSWQESWLKKLNIAYGKNQLSQFITLQVDEGWDVESFADYFIKALMCESESFDLSPCHECRSCHMLSDNYHLDVMRLEDSTSAQIGVDKIRELQPFVGQTAHTANGKIVYIPKAYKLNRFAANALLKLTEEPASNVRYIMIIRSLNDLPTTLNSRASNYRLSTEIDFNSLLNYLHNKNTETVFTTEETRWLWHWFNGAPMSVNLWFTTEHRQWLINFFKIIDQCLLNNNSNELTTYLLSEHLLSLTKISFSVESKKPVLADIIDFMHRFLHLVIRFKSSLCTQREVGDYSNPLWCSESWELINRGLNLETSITIENDWLEIRDMLKKGITMNSQLCCERMALDLVRCFN